jgi:hypothetical protein
MKLRHLSVLILLFTLTGCEDFTSMLKKLGLSTNDSDSVQADVLPTEDQVFSDIEKELTNKYSPVEPFICNSLLNNRNEYEACINNKNRQDSLATNQRNVLFVTLSRHLLNYNQEYLFLNAKEFGNGAVAPSIESISNPEVVIKVDSPIYTIEGRNKGFPIAVVMHEGTEYGLNTDFLNKKQRLFLSDICKLRRFTQNICSGEIYFRFTKVNQDAKKLEMVAMNLNPITDKSILTSIR